MGAAALYSDVNFNIDFRIERKGGEHDRGYTLDEAAVGCGVEIDPSTKLQTLQAALTYLHYS